MVIASLFDQRNTCFWLPRRCALIITIIVLKFEGGIFS